MIQYQVDKKNTNFVVRQLCMSPSITHQEKKVTSAAPCMVRYHKIIIFSYTLKVNGWYFEPLNFKSCRVTVVSHTDPGVSIISMGFFKGVKIG